ncbi:hypothetical protein GOZ96_04820 [Agrobacterium vitis]|uniref:Uncharacterized protein n=1 Tax=Agrobacterium vitis TaxID=373 RepID=A0A7J4X595_AGRVI|nr:hypothetical protein [Agrobacterium vitis]KAA3527063.1 hypothetical protein DXT89_14105 [Agrobacterium vitis]MUZ95912.1 hypothetical protein [Agrobacterium vitis]
MRWKPLEGREMPKWVEYPILAIFMPLIAPLIAMFWLEKQKRKLIGPRAEWSPWFAWHPVRSDSGFGHAVWLEWVERRVWYGNVEHRTLEEVKACS